MVDWGILGKLLHVALALWFVAGLVGRTLALAEARRSSDIVVLSALARLAGRFDRLLVIPGSQAVLVSGLLAAWLEGFPLLGFLQGARANWLLVSLLLFVGITALVPTVFIPSGKVFDQALARAIKAASVTSELTAALNDHRVAWAHRTELLVISVIIVLMVLKPF